MPRASMSRGFLASRRVRSPLKSCMMIGDDAGNGAGDMKGSGHERRRVRRRGLVRRRS